MKKNSSKLNVVALICAVIMVVSCFLPWVEVSSSTSIMGQSSSFYSSASGIQSGVGFIALFLGIVCMVMVFLRSKFMIIPGIFNLIFSYIQGCSMEDMASSVSTSFGSGHAGPSYGIFILILSGLIYVISCTISLFRLRKKREQPITQAVQEVNTPPVQFTPAPEHQSLQSDVSIPSPTAEPELQFQENIAQSPNAIHSSVTFPIKKNKLSGFQKGLIIAGIVIGVYALIFVWADSSSEKYQQERTQKENYERERIERIIEKVNQAMTDKQYELALTNANSIQWMVDNDDSHIAQYNTIKSDFIETINELIREKNEAKAEEDRIRAEEIATQQAYLKAIENETDNGDEPPSFPFNMTVSSVKAYLYAEPDVNSDRIDFLTMNAIVSVMASQYDFMFCKYQGNDGKSISGWIYYKDIQRIND